MNWLKKLFSKKPAPCCEACCILDASLATDISNKHRYWTIYCGVAEGIRTAALAGEKQSVTMYYYGNPPHVDAQIMGILTDIKDKLEVLGYVVVIDGAAAQVNLTVAWT